MTPQNVQRVFGIGLLAVIAIALLVAAPIRSLERPAQGASLTPPGGWPWPERHRDVTGTWLDAFNHFDLIPGPPFLGLYALGAGLLLLALRGIQGRVLATVEPVSALDSQDRLRAADKLNYQEAAYLRGGRMAVIETVAANLLRQSCIDAHLRPVKNASPHALDALEKAVFAATESAHDAAAISAHSKVGKVLDGWEDATRARLAGLGLLPGRTTRLVSTLFAAAALVLVVGLGWIRLERSLLRGYTNVGLLEVEMAALGIASSLAFRRTHSRAGARHLRAMQQAAQPVLRDLRARKIGMQDPVLVYALAATGVASLGGPYADLQTRLTPPVQHSSGDCSGCGGGGCGGGGCGGGGCGGG